MTRSLLGEQGVRKLFTYYHIVRAILVSVDKVLTWSVSLEDVDECGENPCGEDADCVNLPGTFFCSCQKGFAQGADGQCAGELFPFFIVFIQNDCDQ